MGDRNGSKHKTGLESFCVVFSWCVRLRWFSDLQELSIYDLSLFYFPLKRPVEAKDSGAATAPQPGQPKLRSSSSTSSFARYSCRLPPIVVIIKHIIHVA